MYPDGELVPAAQQSHPLRIRFAERLGAALECFLCSGFPTQVLLILILTGFGLSIQRPEGGFNPQFVFAIALLDSLLVVGLVLFFMYAHGERIADVLIGRVQVIREILVGIALVPVALFIVGLVIGLALKYAPWLHNVPRNPLQDMLGTRTDAAIFAVVVMIAGGVREEVQRGFIIHRFRHYLGGPAIGVIVHSVAFGLGHYEQGKDAMIATGLLGLFWGIVFIRRRSIVAPMASHATFNLAQVLQFLALR